jgi:uncharacterized protein (DUF1684 family)
MKKILFSVLPLLLFVSSFAQTQYADSMRAYLDDYVKDHDVVKGDDKKYFQFFPVDENYRVIAKFEKASGPAWFSMNTSGKEKKMYRVFGTISFTLNDTLVKLNLYQSQSLMSDANYKDYLLLLFTDATTGNESYESGRYLDFKISDIKNNQLVIDFNKAYNPYCAYEKNKYNCPIPPHENTALVAIRAGEKNFSKTH